MWLHSGLNSGLNKIKGMCFFGGSDSFCDARAF